MHEFLRFSYDSEAIQSRLRNTGYADSIHSIPLTVVAIYRTTLIDHP